MKKIFLTGADGLLGSNVVRELLKRGYEVKVLIQPGSKSKTLEGLPIEKVEADLLDKDKVLQATSGANVIIHIAAITDMWPNRSEIFHKVNVEGTKHIIEASLLHQVERLIHVSSSNTFIFGTKENPATEKSPMYDGRYGLDYMDTKLKAQQLVLEAVEKQGLKALVVNPTFMIGAYDAKPSSGALLLSVVKGKVPGFSPGGKNWSYVGDVAKAMCNAIQMGKIGESYILGGANLSYKEAISQMCEVAGRKAPIFTFPPFLVKMIGRLGSLRGYLSGKVPKLSYPMARVACDGHYFSPEKAIRELDLQQTPLKVAVREALDWFVDPLNTNSQTIPI